MDTPAKTRRRPKALRYERACLYLALHHSTHDLWGRMPEDAFEDEELRALFKMGCAQYERGVAPSEMSIQQEADEHGYRLSYPVRKMLAFKNGDAPDIRDLKPITEKLISVWALRRTADVTAQTLTDIYEAKNTDASQVLSGLVEQAEGISAKVSDFVSGGTSDRRLFFGKSYVRRRKLGLERKALIPKIGFGWPEIDKWITYGMVPGKMTVLAGRPSMGKSAVKTNIIRSLCERGFGILSFTPEMGIEGDGDRMDALTADIPLQELAAYRKWVETDPRRETLTKALREQSKWPMYIYPSQQVSVSIIAGQLRRLEREERLVNVVFIDLFDRLSDVQVSQQKNYVVGKVLNRIMALAEQYQVHFVNLVQIHRLGRMSSAQKYKPTMQDLKDSGAFEEYADIVLLLWREGFYNKAIADDRIDICLSKQRGGVGSDTLWIPLMFQKEYMRILSLMEETPKVDTTEKVTDEKVW